MYESKDTGAVKADKLAARLETLGPGLWLHIDHAATDDEEMRAFGHQGYEWVAADRSAVLEAWTSSKVREVIARRDHADELPRARRQVSQAGDRHG